MFFILFSTTFEYHLGFKIRKPNQYLPESFEIKMDEPSRAWDKVQRIWTGEAGELWFKADSIFNLPRGIISISLRSRD